MIESPEIPEATLASESQYNKKVEPQSIKRFALSGIVWPETQRFINEHKQLHEKVDYSLLCTGRVMLTHCLICGDDIMERKGGATWPQ